MGISDAARVRLNPSTTAARNGVPGGNPDRRAVRRVPCRPAAGTIRPAVEQSPPPTVRRRRRRRRRRDLTTGVAPRGPVSWRSIALGLAGVVLICAVTPYNDYALNNTFLVGNNLPIGVVMLTFLFVLCVNAPLRRWLPRHAVSAGELAVALSMTLVGCGLPSSGLMRYLPPALVSPFYGALTDRHFLDLLQQMHLPAWAFPNMGRGGPDQWKNSPVVIDYVGRWTEPGSPPYGAWVRPLLTWGVFLGALYGSLLCLIAIVRRQWFENERLAFPLAQIQLALIDDPAPGHALNATLRQRSFWVACLGVFALHGWNGLSLYFPKQFPQIPVYYNVLYHIMSNPPWSYVMGDFKGAAIFFTAVGVTYFLSNSIAFSLWFFFVALQAWRMIVGSTTGDPNAYGTAGGQYQHLGGVAAFVGSVLWVGRRHWRLVIAQAWRGHRTGEPRGRYLSYRAATWGFVACLAVMVGWLWLAGCTLVGATVMVLVTVVLFMVITRIIAESGLMHGQLQVPITSPWTLAAAYGHPLISPLKTFYFASTLQATQFDFREPVPVYATHGLKLVDQTAFAGGDDGEADGDDATDSDRDTALTRRTGRRILALLTIALLVGYVVSFGSTLWMEYRYGWTLDTPGHVPNDWGVLISPQAKLIDATETYARGPSHPPVSPAANIGFGFVLVSVLSALRLRFAWWPLHPIGYLMLYTYPGTHLWLSIFLGWLAKNLILRFGGPKLYTDAKPFFLGLIVGESAAAAFWLVLGIALCGAGLPYRAVNIMPG
jgi:hypothetical protein